MSRQNHPIIEGPEPSGLAVFWQRLRSALAARRAAARVAPADRPAKRAAKPAPDPPAAITPAERKAWRAVHGPPAIWMAPLFLAFAALYALPHLAEWLRPEAPRAVIDGVVAALPAPAARLGPMLAGWLWAPWWLGLLALVFRLRAAWTAQLAILDAVGWGMAALVVEGAAWLVFGREALAAGFSPAERTGAWQLLAAEAVFLFLTAVLFAPTSRQRIRFEQG